MPEIQVARTLVKSPPEVWAAMSDAESLARHLDAFGEIRITRLEPETTVAWEGERASGTVLISASGWGTRVTLTAAVVPTAETPEVPAVEPTPPETPDLQPVPDLDPGPDAEPPPELAPMPDLEPVPDLEPLEDPAPREPEPTPLPSPDRAPDVPPAAVFEMPAPTRRGFWASLFGRRRDPGPAPVAPRPATPVVKASPAPVAESPPAPIAAPPPAPIAVEPRPEPTEPPEHAAPSVDAEAVLAGVLDDLGAAHHRPFSRG
jgi:hypothetical protein